MAQREDMNTAMRVLYEMHADWSERTFGTTAEKGPIGPLRHLIKEAEEAIDAPHDPSEFVDCLFLVWDAARRAGFGWDALFQAGAEKFGKLQTRSYARNLSDTPTEHDRSLD